MLQNKAKEATKGQLILKFLFGVFNFFQKMNKHKSSWGIIVVKLNLFVRLLEETSAWKYYFNFAWTLDGLDLKNKLPLAFCQIH